MAAKKQAKQSEEKTGVAGGYDAGDRPIAQECDANQAAQQFGEGKPVTQVELGNQALSYLYELLAQTAFYELPNQVNPNSALDRSISIRNKDWLTDMRLLLAHSKELGAEPMYQALESLDGDSAGPIRDMMSLRLNVANELVALLDYWDWLGTTHIRLKQFEGTMTTGITSIDGILALATSKKRGEGSKLDSSQMETLNQLKEGLEFDRTEIGEALQDVQQEMTRILSVCYSVLHGCLPKPTATSEFTALHRVINERATDEDWKTVQGLIDRRRLLIVHTGWKSWNNFEHSSEVRVKREKFDKAYQEAETKYRYLWSLTKLLDFQNHKMTWDRDDLI